MTTDPKENKCFEECIAPMTDDCLDKTCPCHTSTPPSTVEEQIEELDDYGCLNCGRSIISSGGSAIRHALTQAKEQGHVEERERIQRSVIEFDCCHEDEFREGLNDNSCIKDEILQALSNPDNE